MMGDRVFSLRNPWLWAAGGGTLAIALVAAVAGFIWFPSLQAAALPGNLWQSICTAAGISRPQPGSEPVKDSKATSAVILTAQLLEKPSAVSIGRGATIAHKCAICHGVRNGEQVNTPDLAGQFAEAVYKELQDFRSGARVSAIMTPQVADLTDQDVRDLAAYFSYLPPAVPGESVPAPEIVATGAPMRNIPPCAACHGGLDVKLGAPRLEGESATYIRNQLTEFAAGTRRNDISEQMRNIARRMTRTEIEEAAIYFSSGQQDAGRQ
jgi:cytochrome c553